MALATPTLTNIDSKAKIFLAQSPVHFNLQNELGNNSIQSATIEVYIWRGFQQADLPMSPNIVFNNVKKISPQDTYIAIELHNEIKAFITSSNLNKNNPQNPPAASHGFDMHHPKMRTIRIMIDGFHFPTEDLHAQTSIPSNRHRFRIGIQWRLRTRANH